MRFPKSLRNVLYVAFGYACGMILFEGQAKFFGWINRDCLSITRSNSGLRMEPKNFVEGHRSVVPPRSNIYVGMMSAGKYVETRVQRAIDTWLPLGGWKVEIFADASPSLLTIPRGLDANIVTLSSVDDTAYPPQKKCFMLVKHMFDEHINDYEWFLRVDDDAYIDYDHLSTVLNKINSSLPIFFGSPGFGMDGDDGMEHGMTYLMGGPGMIFSRGLLKLLRPRLSYCIRHMFSPHEDIEIGRCVWKQIKNVLIPVAWEGKELFYQQYDNKNLVADIVMDQLRKVDISRMATYHSVKSGPLLQTVHKHVLTTRIQSILKRSAKYRYDIDAMRTLLDIQKATDLSPKSIDSDLPLVLGHVEAAQGHEPRSYDQWPQSAPWRPAQPHYPRFSAKLPWTFWDKYYRHQPDMGVPMRGHTKREQAALKDFLARIETNHVTAACPSFPDKGKKFLHGYLQVSHHGLQLATAHLGENCGRNCFCITQAQVSYGATLMEDNSSAILDHKRIASALRDSDGGGFFNVQRARRWSNPEDLNPLLVDTEEEDSPPNNDRIIFVIPLQGRYSTLERFMSEYRRNFLEPLLQGGKKTSDQRSHHPAVSNIQLVIVIFESQTTDDLGIYRATTALIRDYQNTFGRELIRYHVISYSERTFSRGGGLQLGSLAANGDDIIFFMDVDMVVTPKLAEQCRRNTQRNKRAWYPIPYSQYDPDRLCFQGGLARSADEAAMFRAANPAVDAAHGRTRIRELIKQEPLRLSEDFGFWRDFGFGIASFYKSDFLKAGGFDLSIEGWGEEDIRLFVSFLRAGVEVFRSKQSDLIHIFHAKVCDPSLTGEQARACARTKASHFASQTCLARTYFSRNMQQ